MKPTVKIIKGVRQPSSPFSHVVRAGDFLFLTSQLSCDLATGVILSGTIEEQTRQAMENVKFLLEQSHSSMKRIVDVTLYLRHGSDLERVDQVYRTYFKPGREPARVAVEAPSPLPGVDLEVKVTALRKK